MSSIDSPCTKVCTIDPQTGLCRGCARSLHEIEHWLRFSDAERRTIMGDLPQRRIRLALRATNGPHPS